MNIDDAFLPEMEPPVPVEPYVELTDLRGLDLEAQLLLQFNKAQRLLHVAEHNKEIPLGQKATALNAIRAILGDIIKLQTDLYNAERLKTLESVLLEVLREFPKLQTEFLKLYKERLGV